MDSCRPALGLRQHILQVPAKDPRNLYPIVLAQENAQVLEQPGLGAKPSTLFCHETRSLLRRSTAEGFEQGRSFRVAIGEEMRHLTADGGDGITGEEQVEGFLTERIRRDVLPRGALPSTAPFEKSRSELSVQKRMAACPGTSQRSGLRPDIE